MMVPIPLESLREHLGRWTDAGLIDESQSSAIAEFEARGDSAGPEAEPPVPVLRHVPVVVEVLGYFGAALAVLAGVIAAVQAWPDAPIGVAIAFAGFGAAVTLAAGAVIRVEGSSVSGRHGGGDRFAGAVARRRRLRSALWAVSTGCLAAVGALVGGGVVHLAPPGTAALAAGAAAVEAVWLWIVSRSVLQHVVMFAAVAVAAATGVAQAAPGLHAWGSGIVLWILAAAWALAAHRGRLAPRNAGYVAAASGLLIGAQLTMETAAGHILAAATLITILSAGVWLRRVWLVGIGAFGVFQFVPQTAARYLPGEVAAPLAVFVVGVVLVAVAVWLARKGRPPSPRQP
jgi:hypothetical protein